MVTVAAFAETATQQSYAIYAAGRQAPNVPPIVGPESTAETLWQLIAVADLLKTTKRYTYCSTPATYYNSEVLQRM